MITKKITLLLALVLTAGVAVAQTEDAKYNVDEDGVVLSGYDVVSYFNEDGPAQGKAKFSAEHDGATYYFASKKNRNAFQADPEAYLPQYGGFCAYAIAAMGAKVPVDPETFKVADGKLYLFFNDLYNGEPMNTLVPWEADEASLMKTANDNWKKM
ncbi:MAG TPA: YHS domain protein [Cytophagales bacterium]|nr:YHS domain protein [Cytophagales bacterium]HAP59767.1 YHS domain protein [Cytophagales bacterium]